MTQNPLFKDDSRGGQIFALVFVWIMIFVAIWQTPELLSSIFYDYCSIFVMGIGITLIVVVLQVRVSEKVYPLLYITPVADIVMIKALGILGFPGLSGILSMIAFLVAMNSVILALAWDEIANRSVSGVSNLWLSIMPIACLMILSSSSVINMIITWGENGSPAQEWLLWPFVWLSLAVGLFIFFIRTERRGSLPREDWRLPPVLLVWSALTFTVGPLAILLANFNWSVILAVVTSGIVQFGVAGAEQEALMRNPTGSVAVALAIGGGFFLTLICVVISSVMTLPIP